MVPCKRVFPQGTNTDEEEPHCKTPEPETYQNAYNFDYVRDMWCAQEVFGYKQVCLAAKLGWTLFLEFHLTYSEHGV